MAKLTILLSFMAIIVSNACNPPKNCDETPFDLTVFSIAYTNNPILGTPIKNMPFVMTVTNCLDLGQSIIKSDTLFTNEKGRVDTTYKGLRKTCSDVNLCQPKVEITPITPPKFVRWGFTVVNNTYEFKDRAVLKLQIKHDSTDVNELFLSASQKDQSTNLQLVETRTTATNKAPFNLTLLFNIAKGEDAQLNIQFDKKIVRLDTIKASQLDTIFRLITL